MATAVNPSVRVECRGCPWRGCRVRRDPNDPNKVSDLSGFGACPRCGETRLRRYGVRAERKAAKAKEELQALAQGDRL